MEEDKFAQNQGQTSGIQRLLADAISYKAPLDDLNIILRSGADVNGSVKNGLKPLHYAVYVNYTEAVRLLIDYGSDVNAVDDVGYTPMHICSRKGHMESMLILIQCGANANYCVFDENTDQAKLSSYSSIEPLNLAVENNHVSCVKLLLEKGATPNHRYFMGYEINLIPLENYECLEILLQHGADPNVHSRCGITPLIKACKERNRRAAEILLLYGANIDMLCATRFDNKAALHYAVESGDIDMAQFILNKGARTTRQDYSKYAPLHCAVLRDRLNMCELLYNYGAHIDETTDDGCTPLMLACATPRLQNFRNFVEFFLSMGADPNAHSGYYNFTSPCLSPIIEYFINSGTSVDYDIVLTLLSYGAKVSMKPASKILRMRDPYGILQYIGNIETQPDVFWLILSASKYFDRLSIERDRKLPEYMKSELLYHAYNPKMLQQTIRLRIRDILGQPLPYKIYQLPLPPLIKNYLLFKRI